MKDHATQAFASKMKVPFFDYTRVYASEGPRYDAVLKDVLYRSDFIMRQDLLAFEKELAQYIGVRHVIGVANGTDAIWLALLAGGIKPGDEVIMPSHTYVATAGAARTIGAIPVLVDCGDDHLIDPKSVNSVVSTTSKALIPVQLNGRTAKMDPLMDIARQNNLIIVEDSAQGLGSRYKGRMAGTFGLAGTYSFFPAKVLGCFGDGGAVVTDNDNVAEKIRLLRDHGRDEKGNIRCWGFNSRLDNIQAAILFEKLKTFDRDISQRRKIAKLYHEGLSDIHSLLLPAAPEEEPDHFDTYQNFEVEVTESRDELREFLANEGVGTIVQWGGKALHQMKELGFKEKNLPRTDLLFQRAIMLPMNQYLSEIEAEYVIYKIREFYDVQ